LIGVNVSGYGAKNLKEAMDKEKLPWRSFADAGPIGQGLIASKWNLSATPTFYVIDPQGVIRYKWLGSPGAKPLDTALEKLIREAEDQKRPK
jgi:peroxiredoxin